MMKLYVKYMVSRRCIMAVKYSLEEIGIQYSCVRLGVIETIGDTSPEKIEELRTSLAVSSLKLMDNNNAILIENIKICIRELVHHSDEELKVNLSAYLSKKLNRNYTYLSNLFSKAEGVTIEQFIIIHRIERVKELLIYDELTLTEIAYKMNYSSVAYLSYQFKKIAGITPTEYKRLNNGRRKNIEDL